MEAESRQKVPLCVVFVVFLDGWFHTAEAWAFDEYGFAVMDNAVENGGGHGVVVGEGFVPVAVGAVGSDDGGSLFVSAGKDLKKQLSAELVDG